MRRPTQDGYNGSRRWPRAAGRWHAEIQLHGFEPTRVTCVNVSRGGAAIIGGAALLPVGTICYLRLPGNETDQTIVTVAEVVHRRPEQDTAGVRFLDVAASSAMRLGQLVTDSLG